MKGWPDSRNGQKIIQFQWAQCVRVLDSDNLCCAIVLPLWWLKTEGFQWLGLKCLLNIPWVFVWLWHHCIALTYFSCGSWAYLNDWCPSSIIAVVHHLVDTINAWFEGRLDHIICYTLAGKTQRYSFSLYPLLYTIYTPRLNVSIIVAINAKECYHMTDEEYCYKTHVHQSRVVIWYYAWDICK